MNKHVDLSIVDRQEPWVLQSASADRPDPPLPLTQSIVSKARQKLLHKIVRDMEIHNESEVIRLHKRSLHQYSYDLEFQRAINRLSPNLLNFKPRQLKNRFIKANIAVIICGELRCLTYTYAFIKRLSKYTDLFICTNSKYAKEAFDLAPMPWQRAIIDDEPSFPVTSIHQWHKLSIALELMNKREKERGFLYSHFVKVRTDYFYLQPSLLLDEVKENQSMLLCASDKVFSAPRMMANIINGFYSTIYGFFDQKAEIYWPINVSQILESDDSSKWYGMRFPPSIVGRPKTVEELRSVIKAGGVLIADQLRLPYQQPPDGWHTHVKGHARFASELSFARYLNFCGVVCRSTPSLAGFLLTNRNQQ
ncbi:hypothetical protein [Prochlorococcus marinus]|uniref:hypothetical protein n=1 Tax=Prochlorococcus marinus TaxID=1219 RepID=UPI0007B3EEEB|nr:hypothetical protein [Prochlorococcus marinus]KZR73259.1 hypothetical protein PMIT1320_01850 [Prochlorococcus marinus str. MIT 1320]